MVNHYNNRNRDNWQVYSFFESRRAAAIFKCVYAAAILLSLGIGLATVYGGRDPFLAKVSFVMGLVGFTMIALQVVLGSRLKTLDRVFGLDKVMIFHRKMGVIAVALLLSHPILMALGRKSLALFSLHTSWKVDLGKAALLLIVAGALLALYFPKFRLDYNAWQRVHKVMLAAVILAFVHSLVLGDAFKIGWVVAWWVLLIVCACGAFLWQNLLVPRFDRKLFVVKSVQKQTRDTFTLAFEPAQGGVFSYRPGQFMFLKLRRNGRTDEEHPFTISSSPTESSHIAVTIKKSGNYTNTIEAIKPGDHALIRAPFGRFSWVFNRAEGFIFIAGGVGITPIRSMITALCDTGDKRKGVLIYANKTEQDIIFRSQFDHLPANFRVAHVLSSPGQHWKGSSGHVNAQIIKNAAGELLDYADVYLCGPPAMMRHVVSLLESLGTPKGRIHFERFTI